MEVARDGRTGSVNEQSRQTLRVFVSSTFRDMHAERDILVTVVFPELRERLEQLGWDFFDVDLRWGIPATTADGESANSWDYCRQWIDRVQPFFICILGERYGWIPPAHEIRNAHDREIYAGMSITEMEIRHAVIDSALNRRSFFYLRGASVPKNACAETYRKFVDSDNECHLESLKAAITECRRPVCFYPCAWNGTGFEDLEAFGVTVLEDLWSGVLRDERYVSKEVWRAILGHEPDTDPLYTDESEPIPRQVWEAIVHAARPAPEDPLDDEAAQMDAFAAARLRWFHGRDAELTDLGEFVDGLIPGDAERLCVVRGEAGAGKSSLLARLATHLRALPHVVITHFVGATDRSADVRSMLERLLRELNRHGISPDVENEKQDLDSLKNRFASRLATYAGPRRVILLIDGVNQLTDDRALSWLPHRLGDGVRFVISVLDDPAAPWTIALDQRSPRPRTMPLSLLCEEDVHWIVQDYLREYCKELAPDEENAICRMKQSKNPLYLLVMLHELRMLSGQDSHLAVIRIIGELATRHPDTVSLFDWMLARLEVFGFEAARRWWMYLAIARVGMSGRELRGLLEQTRGKEGAQAALRIERSARQYLQRRGAQWDFFHGQLREAVLRRYGGTDHAAEHAEVAAFFHARWRDGDRHAIAELPYHQMSCGRWDDLATSLTDLDFIEAKCAAGMTYDLAGDYNAALAALPEGRDALDEQRRRDELLARYMREMVDFARRWSEVRDGHQRELSPVPTLEAPRSVRPWTAEEIDAERARVIAAPNRLDRVRAFGQFVAAESPLLSRFGAQRGFCAQHAYNLSAGGPVAQSSEQRIAGSNGRLLRCPHHRSAWNPHSVVTVRSDAVQALDWLSPDGSIALSGQQLWSVETGRRIRSLALNAPEKLLALTPDLRIAALDVSDQVGIDFEKSLREPWSPERQAFYKPKPEDRFRLVIGDPESGRRIHSLIGHTKRICRVSLTPDGGRAVSWGEDLELRLWSLTTGKCERLFDGTTAPYGVTPGLALTPDGRFIVFCDEDTAYVWEADTGLCRLTIKRSEPSGGQRPVLAVSDDGLRAVIWRTVWDLRTGRPLHVLRRAPSHRADLQIDSIAVTADGRYAVSVYAGLSIQKHVSELVIWDLGEGRIIRTLQAECPIAEVRLSADGRVAVTGTNEVWNVTTGRSEATSQDRIVRPVDALCLSPDQRVAVLGVDRDLEVWDVDRNHRIQRLSSTNPAEKLCFAPDGRRVVVLNGFVAVWDLQAGRRVQTVAGAMPDEMRVEHEDIADMRVSPDGSVIFISYAGWSAASRPPKRTGIFDLQSGRRIRVFPDGLSSIGRGGRLMIGEEAVWDAEHARPLWRFADKLDEQVIDFETRFATPSAVTADGRLTFLIRSKTLKGFDLASGQEFERSFHAADLVRGPLRVSPDDRVVVAIDWDGRHIVVWRLDSGRKVLSLDHGEEVMAYEFTTDGRFVVSASRNAVRVWDIDGGECRAVLPIRTGVRRLAVKGTLVAIGDAQGGVHFYHLQTSTFIPIVTAERLWRFGANGVAGSWEPDWTACCDWCGERFAVPAEILDVIDEYYGRDRSQGASGPDARNDLSLVTACPQCRKPLRFNPFVCNTG